MENKIIVGKNEWCSLPDLGLPFLKARIDSGAKTSALHAVNIKTFEKESLQYVTFEVHPLQENKKVFQQCQAPLLGWRDIKSSNGELEKRPVIQTAFKIGDHQWDIEVTLTNRESMGYRMLIGREAMSKRILIDPETSFYFGNVKSEELKKHYKAPSKKGKYLKIVVLASNPNLYSNKRIMEAGAQCGHEMIFVNIRHCYLNISSENPKIYYRGGQILENIDAVIPRIKLSLTFYGCALTRQFKATGTFCLNDSASIAKSRDKLGSLQTLIEYDVQMPTTGFAHSPLDTSEMINMVGGAPLVVKLLEGTQGKGVVLAETKKAAESVINAFKSLKANILVQEFVKEAQGKDIRCFVIDGKVVGAIQREAKEGEFRANLHLGGTASQIKPTLEEKRISIKAAKAMGLKVAGVDLIRSKSGPKVLEINSSPGLEGIETTTGSDIAHLMIQCIEKYAK